MFCEKETGKYDHWCTRAKGHKGACSSTFVSRLVERFDEKAGKKLALDSYSTPGNKGAAKNRANRCFEVQYTKMQIWEANKRGESGTCIPKRFSSTPADCFDINIDLATQIVSMLVAEDKLERGTDIVKSAEEALVLQYLQARAKRDHPPDGAPCRICKKPMKLENFDTQHGTSGDHSAQLGHIHPYIQGHEETAHVKGNVQWIHRHCNIIQGEKTEQETFVYLAEILRAQEHKVEKIS